MVSHAAPRAFPSAGIVVAIAGVIVGFGMVDTLRALPGLNQSAWALVVSCLFAITAGEIIRNRLEGHVSHLAPVSLAGIWVLAFSGAQPDTSLDFPAGVAVSTTVVGVVLSGLLGPPPLPEPRVHPPYLARRVIVAAVAAIMYRHVPVGSRSLLEHHVSTSHGEGGMQVPMIAACMVVIVMLCSALDLSLAALEGQEQAKSSLWARLLESANSRGLLVLSVGFTSALAALAEQALGLWSLLIFMAPQALLQLATIRHESVLTINRQTIRALSRLTELSGYTDSGHAARVADLSVRVGEELGMTDTELDDLELAGLLHDIGQASLQLPLPHGATVEAAPQDQRAIASSGANVLTGAGHLARLSEVVAKQATPYVEVRERGGFIPLPARIIKVVNAYDDFSQGRSSDRAHDHAIERLSLGLGYEYDPVVFDALVRVFASDEDD